MQCSKCGNILPNDSEFCPYCGAKVQMTHPIGAATVSAASYPQANQPAGYTANGLQQRAPETIQNAAPSYISSYNPSNGAGAGVIQSKKLVCKNCGGPIDSTNKCVSCGKPYSRFSKKTIAIICASLVLAVLIGLNIYQYVDNRNTVARLQDKISENISTIDSKDSEISTLNSELADAQLIVDDYDTICSFLTSSDAGYASNSFRASNSIIVLNKTETKSFTLTATFYGTYNIGMTGSSASVDFSQDTWYGTTTTINVTPYTEGITTATFSNSVNSQTFRVLVVVI